MIFIVLINWNSVYFFDVCLFDYFLDYEDEYCSWDVAFILNPHSTNPCLSNWLSARVTANSASLISSKRRAVHRPAKTNCLFACWTFYRLSDCRMCASVFQCDNSPTIQMTYAAETFWHRSRSELARVSQGPLRAVPSWQWFAHCSSTSTCRRKSYRESPCKSWRAGGPTSCTTGRSLWYRWPSSSWTGRRFPITAAVPSCPSSALLRGRTGAASSVCTSLPARTSPTRSLRKGMR